MTALGISFASRRHVRKGQRPTSQCSCAICTSRVTKSIAFSIDPEENSACWRSQVLVCLNVLVCAQNEFSFSLVAGSGKGTLIDAMTWDLPEYDVDQVRISVPVVPKFISPGESTCTIVSRANDFTWYETVTSWRRSPHAQRLHRAVRGRPVDRNGALEHLRLVSPSPVPITYPGIEPSACSDDALEDVRHSPARPALQTG